MIYERAFHLGSRVKKLTFNGLLKATSFIHNDRGTSMKRRINKPIKQSIMRPGWEDHIINVSCASLPDFLQIVINFLKKNTEDARIFSASGRALEKHTKMARLEAVDGKFESYEHLRIKIYKIVIQCLFLYFVFLLVLFLC